MDTILKKPLITEKSIKLAKDGWFTFLVDKRATKDQIANVVEEKFDVDVVAVRTVSTGSEKRMQRARRKYYIEPGAKKAIVHLKKGQKIDLFETPITNQEEKEETKEKKSFLKGTKVKIEKSRNSRKEKTEEKKGEEN